MDFICAKNTSKRLQFLSGVSAFLTVAETEINEREESVSECG
jgi:hypothetical protein